MAHDKIREIRDHIQEKTNTIKKKTHEIDELKEELVIAEQEVEVIINEKTKKLEKIVDEIKLVEQFECIALVTQVNQLTDAEWQLIKCVQIFVQMQPEPKLNKTEAVSFFLQRNELIDVLNDRRNRNYPKPIFEKLSEFVQSRVPSEFSQNNLLSSLFNYLVELYRKLNIKNTMSANFMRIREIRTQIDSCTFTINYAK
jgi:hypothetical protein